MLSPRLTLAVESNALAIPEGRIAVFGARAGQDLSVFPKDRTQLIQQLFPDHQALKRQGWTVVLAAQGPVDMAVVFLPRAKVQARDMLAQAAALCPQGTIVVDGQKTDGIDSVLKEVKKRVTLAGSFSKAHGRLFWFASCDFSDWRKGPAENADGFVTAPGVFSADGIDPASRLLAENLPDKIKGRVADFGAGWGYLSAMLQDRAAISELHLIEADHTALECARRNVTSDKARFHWADATEFRLPDRADVIVMNPPFHSDRKADPELGRRFIASARQNLKLSGQLFLVANRHLPYERILSDLFAVVKEGPGTGPFKTFTASKPRR